MITKVLDMSIPSEDVIINAINHDIRRNVLRLLKSKQMSYSQILDHFALTSGKLNYHLKLLSGFIEKKDEGLYRNTQLGDKIINILEQFNDTIRDEDRPFLKKAFASQMSNKKSFLRIRLVGGIYLKIILLSTVFVLIIILAIMYTLTGVSILYVWPFYLLSSIIGITGFIWVFKQYKPAKEFVERVDKLLKNSE